MKFNRSFINALSKFLLSFVFFTLGASLTMADNGLSADDPFVLQEGRNDVSAFKYKKFYASFTAPTDGTLTLAYYNTDIFTLIYTDSAFTEQLEETPIFIGTYPTVCDLVMTEGTTYYFYRTMMLNADVIEVAFGESGIELAMTGTTPASGTKLSASSATASIVFNRTVTIETAKVSVGTDSVEIEPTNVSNSVLFDLTTVLMDWYEEDLLEDGSEIVITLFGVANTDSVLYNGNGICSATYTTYGRPVCVESQLNTPENGRDIFYSYMIPDETTKLTLTFDGDLDTLTLPNVYLYYGNVDNYVNGGYYTENLAPVFEDQRTIVVEMGGVLRRQVDMIPNYTLTSDDIELGLYDFISIKVAALTSTDGQFIYTGVSGNTGSFTFNYIYVELFNNDVATDFTLDGSDFDSSTKIEIWLRGYEYLSYSGITFKYIYNGATCYATVPADELTIVPDPDEDDAVLIYVTIPDFATDEGSKVVVSFADLESQDGLDYSSDLSETYKTAGRTTIVDLVGASLDGGAKHTVYSLSGMIVRKNAEWNDVLNLKRGIYIVDGRKYLVK